MFVRKQREAADDACQSRERRRANTSTKMRDVCPSALPLRMRERCLDDEADARALEGEIEKSEHAH